MHGIQKKAFTFQLENEVPPMVILSFQKFWNNKLRKINIIFFFTFFFFFFYEGIAKLSIDYDALIQITFTVQALISQRCETKQHPQLWNKEGGWGLRDSFSCSSVPERIDFWCAQISATAAATNTQVLCQNRAPTEYSVDSSVTLADRSNEHGQCVQRSRDKKSSRARNTQVWAVTEFPIQGHESDRFCKCFIWVLAWPSKIFRATVSWKNTFF